MKCTYMRNYFTIIIFIFISVPLLKASEQENKFFNENADKSGNGVLPEIYTHVFSFTDESAFLNLRGISRYAKNLLTLYLKTNYAKETLQIRFESKSQEEKLLTELVTKVIPSYLGKNLKIIQNIGIDSAHRDDISKWIRARTQICLRNYLKKEDYLKALTVYFKTWYRSVWPQMDGLQSPESLNAIQQFRDKSLQGELFRLEALDSTLSNSETLEYAKLFVAANCLKKIAKLIEPWAATNIYELPIEIQYFLFKNRYNDYLNQKIFITQRLGFDFQSQYKKYLPIRALIENNNNTEERTQEQITLKRKARAYLHRVLNLFKIISKQEFTFNNLIESVKINNGNKMEEIRISEIKGHVEPIHYFNKISRYASNEATASGSIAVHQNIIIDKEVRLEGASTQFIDAGFLKIKGDIILEEKSKLILNAAFIRVEGDIEGKGEIILNGISLKANGNYSSKLKDDFEPSSW